MSLRITHFFDPIADLPADLAALCLSFLDVPSLLVVAQYVSHAWRTGIDGGLPAVWHIVHLNYVNLRDEMWAEVVQKSHGRIVFLQIDASHISAQSVKRIRSLSRLRYMRITICAKLDAQILAGCPLLEQLTVESARHSVVTLTIPPLQFITTLRCIALDHVEGIQNLPSLKTLNLISCFRVDAREPWPADIRDILICNVSHIDIQLLDRIGALQHLTSLNTDWSFVHSEYSSPVSSLSAINRLSDNSTISALQHLVVQHIPFALLRASLVIMNRLCKLEVLCCSLTDQDLQCISQLATNLQQITLMETTPHTSLITNTGLHHLCGMHNITKLDLYGCESITDYSTISTCSQLRYLKLQTSDRVLSRDEAKAFGKLQRLETLEMLTSLDEQGRCFEQFCMMRNLRVLRVSSGEFLLTDTALSALPSLLFLEKFDVHDIPVKTLAELVDRLVLMPTLKHVDINAGEYVKILRKALPRLEYVC